MKKILIVTHCLLNTSAKVESYDIEGMEEESKLRKELLREIYEQDIQLLQLPCPEFTMYGANRWGHVKNQFDNPFYRQHCKNIIQPIITQIQEYKSHDDKFELLGIVAIDGSPSCGYNFTYRGKWGGELGSCNNLKEKLDTIELSYESGVFIDELKKALSEKKLEINIRTLKDQVSYLKNL